MLLFIVMRISFSALLLARLLRCHCLIARFYSMFSITATMPVILICAVTCRVTRGAPAAASIPTGRAGSRTPSEVASLQRPMTTPCPFTNYLGAAW